MQLLPLVSAPTEATWSLGGASEPRGKPSLRKAVILGGIGKLQTGNRKTGL